MFIIVIRFQAFPQTYQEAIESSESENWKAAMREERDSLIENATFTLTTLPDGRNLVGAVGCTLSRKVLMVRKPTRQGTLLKAIAK